MTPEQRALHAGFVIQAAALLTAAGVGAVLVDRLVAKAFKYVRTAIEDERKYGADLYG